MSTSSTETVTVRGTMGDFTMDVVLSEQHTDELTITHHPVEQGADITDHAFCEPAQLTIKGGMKSADQSTLKEYYNELRTLQSSREPFTVVTGKRSYKNMLMKRLSLTTDCNTENILQFTAHLEQIIIAQVSTVTFNLAKKYKHLASPKNNGTKSTVKQSESKSKTIAASVFGGKTYSRSNS